MNSTELNVTLVETIEYANHVSGAIFFLINLFVTILIASDGDENGIVYRKYLLTLQVTSSLVDVIYTFYTPILQVNCRLGFSNSFLAQYINFASFSTIEVFLVEGVINAYFACVYYRRCVVMPRGTRFCFDGWHRVALFALLQIPSWVIVVLTYIILSASYPVPPYLAWVKSKRSFVFVNESPLITTSWIFAVSWGLCMFFMITMMIAQVLSYLNSGVQSSSETTKIYQKRAVIALIFQGTIPTILYVGPVLIGMALIARTQSTDLQESASRRIVSSISAVVFSAITLHTVAHSLTILVCSPAYRRTVREICQSATQLIRGKCSRLVRPAVANEWVNSAKCCAR